MQPRIRLLRSFVDAFPDKPARWQVVDSFPDFTVKVVDTFPGCR